MTWDDPQDPWWVGAVTLSLTEGGRNTLFAQDSTGAGAAFTA